MLKIDTLVLGDYQTNCYIVREAACQSCAVIDPGYDADTVLKKVRELGLTIDAVLLTHGHFDHVGGVEAIVAASGCRLWMAKADWSQAPSPANLFYYPLANCDFTEVNFCEEGTRICAGGLTFEVLATPGHTGGSVCFLAEDALFSGDTLFTGSCGRTDLPGGDLRAMMDSLARLARLEGDFTVWPGHGGRTTLSREKRVNPYLRRRQ